MRLETGIHTASISDENVEEGVADGEGISGPPGYVSSVELTAFRETIPKGLRHTMLFEY